MAIPAAWFIITWGNTTLTEVREIDADLVIDAETLIVPRGGDIIPAPSTGMVGRVLLVGFAETGLVPAELGQTKLMTIEKRYKRGHPLNDTRDIAIWSGYTRYERRRIQATVNGAVLFAFEFRFMTPPDSTTGTETGAPDAPP